MERLLARRAALRNTPGMRMLCWLGVLGLVASMVGGCGGNANDSDSSCGKVQPCGGDPVGTWKITESCVDSSAVEEGLKGALSGTCPTATLQSVHVKQTGSATFNADKTYSSMLTTTFDATLQVPSSCISQGGLTLTCEQLNLVLSQLMNADISSIVCSKANDGCSCKLASTPRTTNDSGNYDVSGTQLFPGMGAGGEFCVKDNNLHMISLDEMTVGSTKIISDIVAHRQ